MAYLNKPLRKIIEHLDALGIDVHNIHIGNRRPGAYLARGNLVDKYVLIPNHRQHIYKDDSEEVRNIYEDVNKDAGGFPVQGRYLIFQ